MHEFEIIDQHFKQQPIHRPDVVLGIGDDAAIFNPFPNKQLAFTTDSLVEEVHFFRNAAPFDIGYKALAVNLSDLAAMGAEPAWFLLSLTLREANENWLNAFSAGLFHLAKPFNVQLIGGDLTQGPMTINITACGYLPNKQSLSRKGAKPEDLIYVTGTLGDAGLALAALKHRYPLNEVELAAVLPRLNQPTPRVAVGQALLELAHSAIDVSDGLLADLSHILEKSQVGASINIDQIPISPTLKKLARKQALHFALTAGDDYELCFTLPKKHQAPLEKVMSALSCPCHCIGKITAKLGLDLHDNDGNTYENFTMGYQHF